MVRKIILPLATIGVLGITAYQANNQGYFEVLKADVTNVQQDIEQDFTHTRVTNYSAGGIHKNPVLVTESVKDFARDKATYAVQNPDGSIYSFIDRGNNGSLELITVKDVSGVEKNYDGSTDLGKELLEKAQEPFTKMYECHKEQSIDNILNNF